MILKLNQQLPSCHMQSSTLIEETSLKEKPAEEEEKEEDPFLHFMKEEHNATATTMITHHLPSPPSKTDSSAHNPTPSSNIENNRTEPKSPSSKTINGVDETALQSPSPTRMGVKIEPISCKASPARRERLKKLRTEAAGRVWIPDIWGQEELLKDWTDCSAFDASLVPAGLMSARAALVEEGRRASSSRLQIKTRV
ncbi:protein BIC1-like [Malania oleifera]|uniref:protein BIC1-like n=1 Tax=Malania oleifera TaxID=397392 RepID=UPI0025AE935A|nr:protein BIC1-like [Malania oleifera]